MAEARATKAADLDAAPPVHMPEDLAVLASLDDGFPHEDSAGRPVSDLSDREMRALDALTARRLCRMLPGWNESWWAVLTPRGRTLVAAARASSPG